MRLPCRLLPCCGAGCQQYPGRHRFSKCHSYRNSPGGCRLRSGTFGQDGRDYSYFGRRVCSRLYRGISRVKSVQHVIERIFGGLLGSFRAKLSGYEDVVLDGYCNPIEMQSHSFVCKPVYLRCYRRRYRRSNSDIHCSNEYELTLKGVKGGKIEAALELFGDRQNKVRSISMDMSPTYPGVSELKFRKATMAADKFHVMQYVYDAVSDVRTRVKKELSADLSKEKRKTPQDRLIMKDMKLLRRSRYALLRPQERWTPANREVADELFTKYEILKQAYTLSQQFRQRYDYSNRFKTETDRLNDLYWRYRAASEIKEFEPIIKMIRKHERFILNFFSKGATNANAERLNGKIQRFVSNNPGIKNRDFILYRIAEYFS